MRARKMLGAVTVMFVMLTAGRAQADSNALAFAIARAITSERSVPDMPEAKTDSAEIEASVEVKVGERGPHSFYSGRLTRITLAVELGAWVADMTYTCKNLNGGHGATEDWLPVNTCGQAIALTAGFHAAGEGLAYLLHRTGHHKLEQIPRWYLTVGNIRGAAYSSANGAYPVN